MTKQNNIPDWAFKAFAGTMTVLVGFITWALVLIIGMSNDIAVVKERTSRYDAVEKKSMKNESRLEIIESKIGYLQLNRRQAYDKGTTVRE